MASMRFARRSARSVAERLSRPRRTDAASRGERGELLSAQGLRPGWPRAPSRGAAVGTVAGRGAQASFGPAVWPGWP